MRLLIAHEHVLFGEGLRSLLSTETGYEIVGRIGTLRETLDQVAVLKPNVVLMSAELAGSNLMETLREIGSRQAECQVVLLGAQDTDDELFEAFRAGAKGYIARATPVSHVLAALRALANGELIISRAQTSRLIQKFRMQMARPEPQPSVMDHLTRREIEVLRCVAGGATNQEIAQQLVISEHTVKIHVRNILDKLKMKNRGEAANFARRYGTYMTWTAH